jgi:hypothetical protein
MVIAPGSGHAAAQAPQPTHMSARINARGGAPSWDDSLATTGADTSSKSWSGTPHRPHASTPAANGAPQRGHAPAAARGEAAEEFLETRRR